MAELIVGVPHRGPSVVTLPFDLAATSSILRDGGVRLRVVEGSYGELSAWLSSGRIHLCRRGPDVDVVAAAGGAPVACCATVMQAVPAQVVAQDGIAAPSELEGRRIAVIDPTMGSTLALRTWLADAGVDVGRVAFTVLGGTRDRLAAVASGAVAATVVTAPGAFDLPAGVRSIADLDEALGPFLFSAVQVHRPTAVERRGDIEVFLAAVMEAIERITGDGEIATKVADVLRVDAPVARAVLDRARRMNWYARKMVFDHAATNAMVAALKRFAYVPLELNQEDWVWDDARIAAVNASTWTVQS